MKFQFCIIILAFCSCLGLNAYGRDGAKMPPRPGLKTAGKVGAGPDVLDSAREVLGVLERLHVSVDTTGVRQAAVRAILTGVDPEAQILSPEDARRLEREMKGLPPEGDEPRRSSIVRAEAWFDEICYVKLAGLYSGAGSELAEQLHSFTSNEDSRIILDIRGAAGTDLESVGQLARTLHE